VRALYGLKSDGAAFRNHLAECMKHMGWEPFLSDRDLWMKAEVRPSGGVRYWAYILIYVDDILCVHHDPGTWLAQLDKYLKMKDGSIEKPNFYLGAKLRQVTMSNGVIAWEMSSRKYIKAAVENVQEHMETNFGGHKLAKKATMPLRLGYKAELDDTPELDAEKANFYQSQIGILLWYVELGRIDIITQVSMLSSILCLVREGHLEAMFHVFAYPAFHHNMRVVFNPMYPDIDMGAFNTVNWKPMYGDVKEVLPLNAPPPRGKEIDLRLYVDSDHADEKFMQGSRTGLVIYWNMALLVWYFKP
jgi:hypothetical protein